MSLKIFISSVSKEFSNERQALREEIQKLDELFVGMELFGSDPQRPANYCVQKVEESDLYVGLFGDNYGSIDAPTGLSFTQLEFEAAARKIPCLIYLKPTSEGGEKDPRQSALRKTLLQRQTVYTFKNLEDLKTQFLIDFIKLLRADLFEKIIPAKRGAIPAEALLSLTKGFIREQVKSVGQDKYISEVYVAREAEKDVSRFINFETNFKTSATTILEQLHAIGIDYGLGEEPSLATARATEIFQANAGSEAALAAVEELKSAFYFREVELVIEDLNSLIMEKYDERFNLGVRALQARLSDKPFVDKRRLSELYKAVLQERFRSSLKNRLETDLSYRSLLALFPAREDEGKEIFLANDLLKDLTRQIERGRKRCLVVVDKAGTGKTNVACRAAEDLAQNHPVVLLSGQMELSSEYDIEFHIQRRLEAAFSGIFSDWMNRVSPSLQEVGTWLFIIIDGINENSRRPLLIQLLKGLLPRLEEKRIKLILTCRDLFWDVFRDSVEPYLFENVVRLHEFTESEWESAVAVYFKRFDIECTLDKEARAALRNPLLLRFFCEAHRGQRIGRVSNLRLLSVFDLYIARTGQSISERHSFLRPESMLNLLIAIAHAMWTQRSASVQSAAVGITPEALSDNMSVYNLVVSENIILEEASHSYSSVKSVRFLYDEFMEYMIARSWVNEISAAPKNPEIMTRLLEEAIDSLGSFPPVMGAILFLDKMLEHDGSVVNEFIKRALAVGDSLLHSQQTSLVYAFENINFSKVDDELIAAVQKFEPHVREDLKDRLARVILKILEVRPDHSYARKYAHQVLEIEKGTGPVGIEDKFSKTSFQPPYVPPLPEFRQTVAGSWPTPDLNTNVRSSNVSAPQEQHAPKDAPQLPPARYHYSEETKISAIGILVQMKDHDHQAIDEGIRKLGRTDLHSALQAMEYVDLAADELVFKTVAAYVYSGQPEYRIYCAWLLRQRYGKDASHLLMQLLIDQDSRVHEYTAGVFEKRLIEKELLDEILIRLDHRHTLKLWHLAHIVRLLGKKSLFHPLELVESYGPRVVKALTSLHYHESASIRLEAYRGLAEYPSFFSPEVLQVYMRQDKDHYIRTLAERILPSD